MRTLLESARPHTIPLGSLIASVLVHVSLGVPVLHEAVGSGPAVRPESFITRALFVPPPDKRIGRTPGERVSFVALGARGHGSTAGASRAVGDGEAGHDRAAGLDLVLAEALTAPLVELPRADTAYSIFEVDETVTRMADSRGPMYPNDLLTRRIEGAVRMRYVVTAVGVVDTASARVLGSTHALFTSAVLAALPGMRFMPATIDGHAVAQLVEQEFTFRIQPAAVASAAP